MIDSRSVSGVVIGYDPGGMNAHGVATLVVDAGRAAGVSTTTVSTTEQAIELVEGTLDVVGLGIDTLTRWSSGPGGWRPADQWLRQRYGPVAQSVVAPNGLRGSMAVGGIVLLMAIGPGRPDLYVTETHPKILLWFLEKIKHDYASRRQRMDDVLARVLSTNVAPANEHEWDAALSAFAALEGLCGRWTRDLHTSEKRSGERLLSPCGTTHFCWPE